MERPKLLRQASGNCERECFCYEGPAGRSAYGDLHLRCGCLVHHDCLVRYVRSQLDDKARIINSMIKDNSISIHYCTIICPYSIVGQCDGLQGKTAMEKPSFLESTAENAECEDTVTLQSELPVNYISMKDLDFLVDHGGKLKSIFGVECEVHLEQNEVEKLRGWLEEYINKTDRKSKSTEINEVVDNLMTNGYIMATTKACPCCKARGTHYHGHNCHHISPYGGCHECHTHYCFRCLCTENDNNKLRGNRSTCLCGSWSNYCSSLSSIEEIKMFMEFKPYPHDKRCGCPICPDCQVGKPCSSCPGNCVVCSGYLLPGPRQLSHASMTSYLSENIQLSFTAPFRLLDACRYVRLSEVQAIFDSENNQINLVGKWIVDNIGQTPLHYVCDGPTNTPDRNLLIDYLLKKEAFVNAFVNARDNSGNTPLDFAAHHGNAVAMDLLLSKGANVEGGRNAEGKSPLMEAAASGNIECVRLLLERGASATALSVAGSSAMSLAVRFGHLNIAILLFEFHPNIDYRKLHRKGEPLLLTAAVEGHCEIGLLLLDRIPDVANIRDRFGYTALHKAVTGQQLDFIQRVLLLPTSQVDLNIADEVYNETALMKACKLGYAEIARLLLTQEGIDVTVRNRSGATALTMTRTAHDDIRAMLTEAASKSVKKLKIKPQTVTTPAISDKMLAAESMKSHINVNLGRLSVVKFPDKSSCTTSDEKLLQKQSGPWLCESDELAALQRDEMEACSGIFGAEFVTLREPPAAAGQPTGCASVQLLCMDHFSSATVACLAGKIRLRFEMGEKYPADSSDVMLSVQQDELSLLDCPSHLCDELERFLVETLHHGDGMFGCVQAANDWLESEQWRHQVSSSSLKGTRQYGWTDSNDMYYHGDSYKDDENDNNDDNMWAGATISAKLAKEILRARIARGMTQTELAGRVYVRKKIIQEYEAGTAIVDFAVLKRIKRELGIN